MSPMGSSAISHDGSSDDGGNNKILKIQSEEQAISSTGGILFTLPTLPTISTLRQKVSITAMASTVSFLSHFSAGIYFPVIEDIGNDVQIDAQKM